MSRLDSNGGFGGPRIVKPQANVYTVLLLIACLFMAAAFAVQAYRIWKLAEQDVQLTGKAAQPAAAVVPVSEVRIAIV
jgi:hypothetical protein